VKDAKAEHVKAKENAKVAAAQAKPADTAAEKAATWPRPARMPPPRRTKPTTRPPRSAATP